MKAILIYLAASLLGSGLERNGCEMSVSAKQYDYCHYNRVCRQYDASLGSSFPVGNSEWSSEAEVSEIGDGCLDITVILRCIRGEFHQGAFSVNLKINGWNRDNFVLMPAVAYNGNRFEARQIRYSPKLCDARDIGADKPMIVSDVPRLDKGNGVSRIQDRSGAFASPSVCTATTDGRGIMIFTGYGNEYGDYCLSFEESRDRTEAVASVTSPCVREETAYTICNRNAASWDKPADFSAGDTLTFRLRYYGFSCKDVKGLFEKYFEERKCLAEGSLADAQSYSECRKVLEEKFNSQNFVPQYGYYSVGMRENASQDWQIGWTGGMISTYPLLTFGDNRTVSNVIRNFDWLFPDGICPAGFFYDSGEKGVIWYGGDQRRPHTANWHLIRKSGDAVYYIIKQLKLMESRGITVKEDWTRGTRQVCDSLVGLWDRYHQFGQFIDSRTGEIAVGGSTSGAIIPAALASASSYFEDPGYLRVAEESAEYMYRKFTMEGITCGGPGDAMQCPDSESSYALMESFAKLYECTGDPVWLEYAEDAAAQYSSWVVSGDYHFPESSDLGKVSAKTTGAVYANVQNKHGAPGICTASGIALFRIYRATGEKKYLSLLQDTAHNITQYMASSHQPIDRNQPGWVSERVNMTDWESPGNIGETFSMSTWAETSLMLTTVELPGVYIEPDRMMASAFDNVVVASFTDRKGNFITEISNPFDYDIEVTVLTENKADRQKPYGENNYDIFRKYRIEAGEKIILKTKSNT